MKIDKKVHINNIVCPHCNKRNVITPKNAIAIMQQVWQTGNNALYQCNICKQDFIIVDTKDYEHND
jgi:DNA-directed RNA polymerase subunit RPC12/RpoP